MNGKGNKSLQAEITQEILSTYVTMLNALCGITDSAAKL
jgi:hypothetical protein